MRQLKVSHHKIELKNADKVPIHYAPYWARRKCANAKEIENILEGEVIEAAQINQALKTVWQQKKQHDAILRGLKAAQYTRSVILAPWAAYKEDQGLGWGC